MENTNNIPPEWKEIIETRENQTFESEDPIDKFEGMIKQISPESDNWNSIPRGTSKLTFLSDALETKTYEYVNTIRNHIIFKATMEIDENTLNKVTEMEWSIGLSRLASNSLLFYLKQHPQKGKSLIGRTFTVENINNKKYIWEEIE